jgi:hypothetical protein
MRRDRKIRPVGDALVSYSAAELPVGYIEGTHREVMDEFRNGARRSDQTVQVLDLLVRISVQKLKATA